MHKFKMEVEVDDTFLQYNLITAVEGGINYWSSLVSYTQTESADLIRAEIIEVGDDDDDGPHHTINVEVIRLGIERLLSEEVKVNRTILGYVLSGVRENDAGYIDADAADAIVQAGLFNELVYG